MEEKKSICAPYEEHPNALLETIVELSHFLYSPLYLKLQDAAAVDGEIIRQAKKFEESFRWDETDFLDQIDEFAKNYFDNDFCNL